MIFTDEPVEREVQTRGIYEMQFEIPAGDANYEVGRKFSQYHPHLYEVILSHQ